MKPTAQQSHAVSLFVAGKNITLNAYAGTGKTATLKLMADATSKEGLYIAFNRAIAAEARRNFPKNIQVSTSHALAFHAIRRHGYSQDQMTGKLNANAIVSVIKPRSIELTSITVPSRDIATILGRTVARFCNSGDKEIEIHHIERVGRLTMVVDKEWALVSAQILTHAKSLWALMIDVKREDVPLGHDGYFKLWSLSVPKLEADFVLVDEAQDSNPALLSVLAVQTAQMIYVGDRFQQIYEWRGAVNAMQSLATSYEALLSQSFRFGEDISTAATDILRVLDPSVAIQGTAVASTLACTNPDAILARRNIDLFREAYAQHQAGCRFHIVGGTAELVVLLEDVQRLQAGQRGRHVDFFGFKDWSEVLQFSLLDSGSGLRTFVRIVDEFDVDSLLSLLKENEANEREADVVLSTVHKAKGLEFDRVVLAEGFPEPTVLDPSGKGAQYDSTESVLVKKEGKEYELLKEEIRILYVALTRARKQIQLPDWSYAFFGIDGPSKPLPERKNLSNIRNTPHMNTISRERYAVLDFETTGFSPQHGDRAIELGIVIVEGDTIVDTYESLMRSDVRIFSDIEQLTGISQEMVDAAPSAESVMQEAQRFVSDAQLVAHNAAFDKRFWVKELQRATGGKLHGEFVCTMLMARRLFPELRSHKLEVLTQHLKIVNSAKHRALTDATATAHLLIRSMKEVRERLNVPVVSAGVLKKLQRLPKGQLHKLNEVTEKQALSVSTRVKPTSDEASLNIAHNEIHVGDVEKVYYKNGSVRGYRVRMQHTLLENGKILSARDSDLLETKVRSLITSWEKKWIIAQKRHKRDEEKALLTALESQAAERTEEAQNYLQSLGSVLHHTLPIDDAIDWNELRVSSDFDIAPKNTDRIIYDHAGYPSDVTLYAFEKLQPQMSLLRHRPHAAQFVTKPNFWEKVSFQSSRIEKRSKDAYEYALNAWLQEKEILESEHQVDMDQWQEQKSVVEQMNHDLRQSALSEQEEWHRVHGAFEARKKMINSKVDELEQRYSQSDPEAVEEYCYMVLSNSEYPEDFPRNCTLEYERLERHLAVTYHLPSFESIEFLESVSVVKRSRELREKYVSKTRQEKVYVDLVCQIMLRTLHELFEADSANALTRVSLNGFVNVLDDSVGHEVARCIAAVVTEKNEFVSINLERVDPAKCYGHIGGVGTRKSIIKCESVGVLTNDVTVDFDLGG